MREFKILFCRPGPESVLEFELEAVVVDSLEFETHVIQADLVVDGESEHATRHLPHDLGPLLYRGPILTAQEYAELESCLAERGATFPTTRRREDQRTRARIHP